MQKKTTTCKTYNMFFLKCTETYAKSRNIEREPGDHGYFIFQQMKYYDDDDHRKYNM